MSISNENPLIMEKQMNSRLQLKKINELWGHDPGGQRQEHNQCVIPL